MIIRRLLFIVFLFSIGIIQAQEEQKFKVVPTGRLLIDGALYSSPEKYLFKDGMAIPEARLGVNFYYGKWMSMIDVGFAYGKIGLRNMWIQYNFDSKNNLRVGNFIQPFGYQSTTTANNKSTFEQPLVSALYTPGIQLGLMYTFQNKNFYSATAFHVESSALTSVMNYPLFNQQGYSVLTRDVWRLKNSEDKDFSVLQAGISLDFSSPERHLADDKDVHDAFTNSAYFPTKVSSVWAINSMVDKAKNRFKLSPELVAAYRRLAFESQYFYETISRRNSLSNISSQGFYVTLRGVLFGTDYSYDAAQAYILNPKKSLEFVADYNFSDFSKNQAGKAQSISLTLNYYFNAYITARLNYTYTKAYDLTNFVYDSNDDKNLTSLKQNAFQLRLMVLF